MCAARANVNKNDEIQHNITPGVLGMGKELMTMVSSKNMCLYLAVEPGEWDITQLGGLHMVANQS